MNELNLNEHIPTVSNQIKQGIVEKQKLCKKDSNINRASSATLCVRRRWYQKNNTPEEDPNPRRYLVFLFGDLAEYVLLNEIKEHCIGPGKAYSTVHFGKEIGKFKAQKREYSIFEQKDLTGRVGENTERPITFTAHLDAVGRRNSDGEWEIIECKSASYKGFQQFEREGPGNYIKQAHACMMTDEMKSLNVRSVRYFYFNKNDSDICDKVYQFDEKIAEQVAKEFLMSNEDTIPARPYEHIMETFRGKPTGRNILQWYCSYCPYTQTCWPEASLEFKSEKPTWVVRS